VNSHSVQSSIDLAVLGPARLDAWTVGEENQKHFSARVCRNCPGRLAIFAARKPHKPFLVILTGFTTSYRIHFYVLKGTDKTFWLRQNTHPALN
jgi:hypothetical protein